MYSHTSAFNHTSYLFSLLLKGGKKAKFERLLHVLTLIYSLNFASTLLMYTSRLLRSCVSSFVRIWERNWSSPSSFQVSKQKRNKWIGVLNSCRKHRKVELTVYSDFVCVPVRSPWIMCNIPPQFPLRTETIHNFVSLSVPDKLCCQKKKKRFSINML